MESTGTQPSSEVHYAVTVVIVIFQSTYLSISLHKTQKYKKIMNVLNHCKKDMEAIEKWYYCPHFPVEYHWQNTEYFSNDFFFLQGRKNEKNIIVHMMSSLSAGIIAVVIFTILCTLVFLIRYMFRHKGTYHTNEAKGSGESAAESADTAIIGTDNPETIDESKKEWFI